MFRQTIDGRAQESQLEVAGIKAHSVGTVMTPIV